jgi:hypothetical protein
MTVAAMKVFPRPVRDGESVLVSLRMRDRSEENIEGEADV